MESEKQLWALWESCRLGNVEAVERLLDKERKMGRLSPNCTGPDGQANALMRAARSGHCQVVKVLLERGALACWQSISEMTPLHFAVEGGNEDTVVELLRGAADPNSENCLGRTPLDEASRSDVPVISKAMAASLEPWTPETHRVHTKQVRALAVAVCRLSYALQREYCLPRYVWLQGVQPFLRISPKSRTL